MKKVLSLLILLFSFQQPSLPQDQHLIDSLENQLKKLNATKLELGKYAPRMNDTIMANILFDLADAFLYNNSDKAMDYTRQTVLLSEQIGYKKGLGNGYNCMGIIKSMNVLDFAVLILYLCTPKTFDHGNKINIKT